MFSFEDGAADLLEEATYKYEKHFDMEFPTFEFLRMTRNKSYDFSLEGVERLIEFIDDRIEKNDPVQGSENYSTKRY